MTAAHDNQPFPAPVKTFICTCRHCEDFTEVEPRVQLFWNGGRGKLGVGLDAFSIVHWLKNTSWCCHPFSLQRWRSIRTLDSATWVHLAVFARSEESDCNHFRYHVAVFWNAYLLLNVGMKSSAMYTVDRDSSRRFAIRNFPQRQDI